MRYSILVVSTLAVISYIFFDKTIAYYFHSISSYNLIGIFEYITKAGNSVIYIVVSFFLYVLYRKRKPVIALKSLFIFLSVVVSGICILVIKFIAARYRPGMLFAHKLYGFSWFHIGYSYNSFPSGHSATAFSAFVGLSLLFPKYKLLFYFFAIIVAISRVIVSAHYLSDIMFGSLIGAVTAVIFYKKLMERESTKS